MEYMTAMLSDQGQYRKSNQDCLLALGARSGYGRIMLLCLCDGMGGYQGGEVASRYCLDGMSSWFKKRIPQLMRQHAEKWADYISEDLRILTNTLNRNLLEYAARKGGSPGSTLTAILFDASQYHIVHVGDSRAYEIGRSAVRITQDQSLAAREVRMGRLTPEQARLDRRRNILLQCLGVTKDVRPLFYRGRTEEGCLYLLCTDGFWHNFCDKDLARELCGFSGNTDDLHNKLSEMIRKCRENGERDNISAACVIPAQNHTGSNREESAQKTEREQFPLFAVDLEQKLSAI